MCLNVSCETNNLIIKVSESWFNIYDTRFNVIIIMLTFFPKKE